MDQPNVIDQTVVQPRPEMSMRVVEYVLSGLAFVAALLLNLAR